jgi:hypothetical protein
MGLLKLDPVMPESSAEQLRPANGILGVNEPC